MNSKISSWFQRHALETYFGLAYAITWAVWIPIALSARGLLNVQIPAWLYYLGSFGPMCAALIVTTLTEGRQGIERLLARLIKWRIGFRYYLFAILGPLGLFALAASINRVVSGAWPDLALLGKVDYLPTIGAPVALLLWLFTYGLGEEIGWRGFALPHLQTKHSAATSALILGAVWTCWHIPAFFFRDTYMAMGFFVLPAVLVSITFASIIFTWLYNSTSGSLLIVIIFHALFDWLSVSDAGGQYAAIIMGIAVVLWAVFIMRRYGPMNAAPVDKQILYSNTPSQN